MKFDKYGCDKPIGVVGTNGGKMPCGATLNMFGKIAPYYCHECEVRHIGEEIMAKIDGKTAGNWEAHAYEGVSRDSVLWTYEGDQALEEVYDSLELHVYSSMPGEGGLGDNEFYISVYSGDFVDAVTVVIEDYKDKTKAYVASVDLAWEQVKEIINAVISKKTT